LQFADLQFADQQKDICAIGDCGLVIVDLKKQLRDHHCKFATGVNDTDGNLPLVLTTQAVNLPPVSMVVHLDLQIFPRIFEEI
jgi:hypothetical protein